MLNYLSSYNYIIVNVLHLHHPDLNIYCGLTKSTFYWAQNDNTRLTSQGPEFINIEKKMILLPQHRGLEMTAG